MVKTIPALASLLAASVLVIPTVTRAQEQSSTRVSYADLDLASAIGQHELQGRIAFAAADLCGPADQRDVGFFRAVAECRTGTIADAQAAYKSAVAGARHPSVTVLDAAALVVTAHK